MSGARIGRVRFAKGHGTENDFVILPDPDGDLDLSPQLVVRLCDRRAGIGGDGVLRVVRTAALGHQAAEMPNGGNTAAGANAREDAAWFMDYWNADGSVAEMCGNGIRVFVRYLLETGLADGDELTVATRGGPHRVLVRPDGAVSVDMGLPTILGAGRAIVGGRSCSGLRISVGNPHLACIIDTPGARLDEFNLSQPPELDPGDFPDGANVELIQVTGPAAVRMRVRERGSGETRSCGTGAVAAAVAAAHRGSDGIAAGSWQVDVPGGELTVTLDGRTSWLTGPAVIVAAGELRDGWLRAAWRI
jgi:diaminopimelate epimerase